MSVMSATSSRVWVAVTMCVLAVALPTLVQVLNASGWDIQTGPELGLIVSLIAAVWMTRAGNAAMGIGLAVVCGFLAAIAGWATFVLTQEPYFSPPRNVVLTVILAAVVGVIGAVLASLWKRQQTSRS